MPDVAPVTTKVFPFRSGMLSAVQRPPAEQCRDTGRWLAICQTLPCFDQWFDDKAWGKLRPHSKSCFDTLPQTWLHNFLHSILCSSGSLFVQAGEGAKCVACILPLECLAEEATNTS